MRRRATASAIPCPAIDPEGIYDSRARWYLNGWNPLQAPPKALGKIWERSPKREKPAKLRRISGPVSC